MSTALSTCVVCFLYWFYLFKKPAKASLCFAYNLLSVYDTQLCFMCSVQFDMQCCMFCSFVIVGNAGDMAHFRMNLVALQTLVSVPMGYSLVFVHWDKTLLKTKEVYMRLCCCCWFVGSWWYVLLRKVRRASLFTRSWSCTCGGMSTLNPRNLRYVISATACLSHHSVIWMTMYIHMAGLVYLDRSGLRCHIQPRWAALTRKLSCHWEATRNFLKIIIC